MYFPTFKLQMPAMRGKVAIITGSNKGIGLAIVKKLCKRFDGVVYLTSRDKRRGLEALEELKQEGCHPEYLQLDVKDRDSVKAFAVCIKERHTGIDILINNAAILNADEKSIFDVNYECCKEVIDVNYNSLLIIEEFLYPLLNDNARVVNISSDCGHLSNVRNKYWIERFSKRNFNVEDINAFVNWFLDNVKNDTFNKEDIADGASVAAYRISKVAMSALTIVQQKYLAKRNISINSMHPGLVRTDMTRGVGFLSVDEAAETPAYLALDAPHELKGQYIWYDRQVLDWYDYKADYYFKSKNLMLR